MKKFVNVVMIFFVLAITLLLNQHEFQTQTIDSIGYIQNIKKETVVLVSNSIFNGDISAYEKKNEQHSSGLIPVLSSYLPPENLFRKNKTQLNGAFIHNLSTNKQKVHQIRAP